MAEMHYADPGAGRRLALHIVLVAAVGIAIIMLAQAYQPALLEWASSDPARMRPRAQMLIFLVGLIVIAPIVGFAAYIWRLGTRIMREERFPPEGMRVIRDVLVLRGAEARSRARLLRAFSITFFVLTVLMALTLLRLATLTPQR
jgi:hypothetical protein